MRAKPLPFLGAEEDDDLGDGVCNRSPAVGDSNKLLVTDAVSLVDALCSLEHLRCLSNLLLCRLSSILTPCFIMIRIIVNVSFHDVRIVSLFEA